MNLVKLDLASLSLMEKIEFALRVGDAMVGHEATFPDPPIAGADFIDLAVSLRDTASSAESARTMWREFLSTQADVEGQLNAAFTQIANYVQNVSGGNVATIAIAGLPVRNPPSPVGRLPMPVGLTAVPGARPGELVLRWKAVRRASSYVIEQTTDLRTPATWTRTGMSTKAKAFVDGLTSGTRYWFRVAALSAAGQGEWSDAVTAVVG